MPYSLKEGLYEVEATHHRTCVSVGQGSTSEVCYSPTVQHWSDPAQVLAIRDTSTQRCRGVGQKSNSVPDGSRCDVGMLSASQETKKLRGEDEGEKAVPNRSCYEHFKVPPKEKIGDFRIIS